METRNRESCPTVSNLGPYKATKLWNDAIIAFRQGVPRGKHRRFMRTAEDCFLGSSAVDWLLEYLKKQREFGSDVTRHQTTHLLNKFYKAGIFEEIQMSRRGRNKADFSDSNRLYRLLPVSPSKGTRVPLAVRTTNTITRPPTFKLDKDEKERQPKKEERKERTSVSKEESAVNPEPEPVQDVSRLPQCHLVGRFLTGSQINEIWKTAALSRLKKVLGVSSLDDIVQDYCVDGGKVRHNCIFLNKSGIVTNIQQQDQLPHWVLSAMKCLARWPEKVEGDLPSYPGFERDVFGVVRDYFLGLAEPLITYDLYDVIINAFVQACNQLPRHSSPFSHASRNEKRFGYSLWSDSSLENVILNLTRKYCMADSRSELYSMTGSRPDLFGSLGEGLSSLQQSEYGTGYSHWFSGAGSRSNLASSGQCGSTRQLGGSHRDLLTVGQVQDDLQQHRIPRNQTSSTLPHSKSHSEFLGSAPSRSRSTVFSEGGPWMAASQRDLRESGAVSMGNLHNEAVSMGNLQNEAVSMGNLQSGRSVTSLHASQSSQPLCSAVARASSQSAVGPLSDRDRDRKRFRSNPDLQVSSYETAFGPENQTVTRVYYCNGLATDFRHSAEQEQEELSPMETHFDVDTQHSRPHRQSGHISFERVNRSSLRSTSSAHNRGTDSFNTRGGVGRSRSYNSFQKEKTAGGSYNSSSALASSSEPGEEAERNDQVSSPQWERMERKPPPYRRRRGERNHTFSGSQFAAAARVCKEAEKEGGGVSLDAWDKHLSVSTPSLPGLKVPGSSGGCVGSVSAGMSGISDVSAVRGLGLSASQGQKRASSLYLNFPQSSLQEERATRALQVVCLFLPPASRRKLHFLLKLMSKMAANPFLTFDPSQSTRSLVLGTFQHAVLRAHEGTEGELDAVLVFQLVSFLMDHHMDIMTVPSDMKAAVEDRLRALEKPQIVYSPRDPTMLRFARPLSMQQYESNKRDNSRQALIDLLDNIVRDNNMPDREKRRRLKQFQKVYPQLYSQRFPDATADPLQTNLRPRIKAPLLVRPLQKLRGLRV